MEAGFDFVAGATGGMILFVLIGFQLPTISRGSPGSPSLVVVSLVVMIVCRLAWVHLSTWAVRAIDRRPSQRARRRAAKAALARLR